MAVAWAPFSGARADGDFSRVPLPPHAPGVGWPTESWPEADLPAAVDEPALTGAVAELFAAIGRGGLADTHASLVVRNGSIVFKR